MRIWDILDQLLRFGTARGCIMGLFFVGPIKVKAHNVLPHSNVQKTRKKEISTRVQIMQHPNAGEYVQQML